MLTALDRFHAKTQPANDGSGCIVWTACTRPNGYGKMNYKYRTVLAHRWIYEQTHKVALPPDVMVLHSCDNRACVNLEHLRAGSAKDNVADMDARGRRNAQGAKGTANAKSKLTEDQVREIRALRARGWTLGWIAEDYGISMAMVSSIARGKSWAHVA